MLNFALPDLTEAERTAIRDSDPALGTATVGGVSYAWEDFEVLQVNGEVVDVVSECPDGTAYDDEIVCRVSPPTPGNDDTDIMAGSGADQISILAGVTVENVYGDLLSGGVAGNDEFYLYGIIGGAYGRGGDDTVTLFDGVRGKNNNTLMLDGGAGSDALRFDFTNMNYAEIERIKTQDPANGRATLRGQTFQWQNFEQVIVNGVAGRVSFAAPTGTVSEDAGTYSVDVTLSVVGDDALPADVSLDVSYSGAGTDDINGPGTFTFSRAGGVIAGTYTQPLTLTVMDDDLIIGDRTVNISLSLSTVTHKLTITEDDEPDPPPPTNTVPVDLVPDGQTLNGIPQPVEFAWRGVGGATAYRVYIGGMVPVDRVYQATDICTERDCTITASVMNGDIQWWVSAITGNNSAWSDSASFTADFAWRAAALPQPTVMPNQGLPTITFPDDPHTLWVQIWLGPSPWGDHLMWYGRGDVTGVNFVCDGTACRINPEWYAPAGVEYTLWMQAWGPGGFSTGGPVAAAPSWTNGNNFSYPDQPAQLPGVPEIIHYDANDQPVFGWEGGARTLWYQIVITTDAYAVIYDEWQAAKSLGCASPGDVCSLGQLDLPLVIGATYRIYVQAWGPGGFSDGGPFPSSPQWNEGTVTYQP